MRREREEGEMHDELSSKRTRPEDQQEQDSEVSKLLAQFQNLTSEQQQKFLQQFNQSKQSLEEYSHLPEYQHTSEKIRDKSPAASDTSKATTTFKRDSELEMSKVVATALGQDTIIGKIIGRTKTNVSTDRDEKQGDHVTARVVLNELIYDYLEGKSYEEIVQELPELLDILGLSKEEGEEIKSRVLECLQERQKLLSENNLSLTKDERRKVIKTLGDIGYFAGKLKSTNTTGLNQEDQVRFDNLFDPEKTLKDSQIKNAKGLIRYGNRAANSITIAVITEALIEELNQQTDPPSAFDRKRNPNGCHDRNEDAAFQNIKLFFALKELVDQYTTINKNKITITNLDQISVRERLLLLQKSLQDKVKNELIEKFRKKVNFIKNYNSNTQTETFNGNLQKFIKEFLGCNLDCSQINEKWIESVTQTLEQNKELYATNIGKAFNILFDFGYVEYEDPASQLYDLKILYKVSARHISYMFNAFKDLKDFSGGIKDSIVNSFFKEILKNNYNYKEHRIDKTNKGQGWEAARIATRRGEKSLDIDILKSEVKKYIDLTGNSKYKFNSNPISTISNSISL